MSYSVLDIKQELTGVLHGTTLNQILDVNGCIYRAGRKVLADIDTQETKRIVTLAPIFNSVYDYALPIDVKGTKIIDIRPQVNRQKYENPSQAFSKNFDLGKTYPGMQFNVDFNSSIKTIRLKDSFLPQGAEINQCDAVQGNGLWSASGNASNLKTDNVNYASGSGSLSFDLSAAGSQGILSNSTMSSQDLTTYLNQGTFFLWAYLPTGADFSSITLRIGSSNTKYYEISTSVTQQNTIFENGWNLLSFNWLGATVVGVPDITKINYCAVLYNYNGNAQTAVRLDSITLSLGTIFDIVYYSKYMFRDASTNAFQEKVTDDSNLINLDTESFDLIFNQLCLIVAQQQQGFSALQFDASYFAKAYEDAKTKYKSVYKSEYQKTSQPWYQQTSNNYNKWAGERLIR